VNTFGFVSIPFMAAAGFLAVAGLLLLHLRLERLPAPDPNDHRFTGNNRAEPHL